MSVGFKEKDRVRITATSWAGLEGEVLLVKERLQVSGTSTMTHRRGQIGKTKPGVLVLLHKGTMRRKMWFHTHQVELVVVEQPVLAPTPAPPETPTPAPAPLRVVKAAPVVAVPVEAPKTAVPPKAVRKPPVDKKAKPAAAAKKTP